MKNILLILQCHHLVNTALMAFLMGKISSYPDADNLPGRTEANYPAPHSQHIGIIVLTGHAGREYIMAESCPDALDLVGSNGNPQPGAAEHDAPVSLATGNLAADLLRNVRIIHGIAVRSTRILHLNILKLSQNLLHGILQLYRAVVAANH